jgi:SAM-dependent methyltransferase
MHPANATFWREVARMYPEDFRNKRVGEFGSYNMNDPDNLPRSLCVGCEYIGIDWRPGPNVDHVSLAHEVELPPFDTVVSASMLEHDPYWNMSLTRMADLLRPGGLFALSWGAAGNPHHCAAEAPDGEFHPLPARYVLDKLRDLGICVRLFAYETRWGGTAGEVALVAFKPEIEALGPGDNQVCRLGN